MEAHHTRNSWTYVEVKRSNIKVTRPGPISVRLIEAAWRAIVRFSNGKFQSIKVAIK